MTLRMTLEETGMRKGAAKGTGRLGEQPLLRIPSQKGDE